MVLSATRVEFPSDRQVLLRQYASRDSIRVTQGIVNGHRIHDELGCRCPLKVSSEMGRTDEYRIATATNHGGRITNLQPLASISPILSLSRDPRTRDCVFHRFPGYGTMVLSGRRPRISPRPEALNISQNLGINPRFCPIVIVSLSQGGRFYHENEGKESRVATSRLGANSRR